MKGILNSRDVQKLSSVKFYSKVVSFGSSFLSLSVVNSLSKTLGPELEFLSSLNNLERFYFLNSLKDRLIKEKSFGCLVLCDLLKVTIH